MAAPGSMTRIQNDITLRRARLTVSSLFLLHGLIYASWVSRIAAVQAGLQLSSATLGLALAGLGLGSLISMPFTGWLIARRGSKPVCSVSSIAFSAALALPGVAPSAWGLGLALTVFGAAAGAMDVSMNAQAVELERRYGRPVMSSFHALFSLGGMAGSGLSAWMAARGVSPRVHFGFAAAAFTLCTVAIIAGLLHEPPPPAIPGRPRLTISPRLAGLAGLAICLQLSEGAMADWSSVYLRTSVQSTPGVAALGYAAFSATMAAGRLFGDGLTLRFGRARLVRYGTLLAAAGLAAALVIGTVPGALAGFACVGAGFSVVIPLVFGAAGRLENSTGPGLAAITTVGYLGLLTGPVIIGFTAGRFTLRAAMGILVVLSLVGSGLSRFVG